MKKIFLSVLILASVTMLLQNCKKTNEDTLQKNASTSSGNDLQPQPTNPQLQQRGGSTDELTALAEYRETNDWAMFEEDNPDLSSNLGFDSVMFIDYYSSILEKNIILVYIPVKEGADGYVIITATNQDYVEENFNNFYVLFHKNLSVTPYGEHNYVTADIEFYGLDVSLHIEESEVGETIECVSTWGESSQYLGQELKLAGPVVPSGACVSASYDNQVADCTGWCHVLYECDVTGVIHLAYAATAVLWCTSHNNNAWQAP